MHNCYCALQFEFWYWLVYQECKLSQLIISWIFPLESFVIILIFMYSVFFGLFRWSKYFTNKKGKPVTESFILKSNCGHALHVYLCVSVCLHCVCVCLRVHMCPCLVPKLWEVILDSKWERGMSLELWKLMYFFMATKINDFCIFLFYKWQNNLHPWK